MKELRVALLASCTIDFLRQPLTSALESCGIQASIWTGGFAQYRQDILNPGSELYVQKPNAIVIYLDGADVFQELLENGLDATEEARRDFALSRAGELQNLVQTLTERLPGSTIFLNTLAIDPANTFVGLEYNSEYGVQDAVAAYHRELAVLARRLPSVIVVDVASLAANLGFRNWFDPRLWYLARSRWSRTAMQALAERYAAAVSSVSGRIRKCIVVDLDNTLWGGIVGEDGIEGLRLSEDGIGRSFAEFQLELLNLQRKGVLLSICSKNNPEDALNVIRNHPSMRLREHHFAAMRINWEDKASNLQAIAEELNIGIDSFVFIDDSPVERSRVRQVLPEVLVPEWPADSGEYKGALLDLAAKHFHKTRITAEDRRTGEVYRAQSDRRKLEASTGSLEEFYTALQMTARIGRADTFTIPRIAQLTRKTNQFNLTTRRYSEAEVASMAEDPDCAVWWIDLTDRFGPNGIVGVMILKRQANDVWRIDTFLLSCRVMGRTVENGFLAAVSQAMGITGLIGEFKPTAKNAAVEELYPRLGFQLIGEEAGARFFELPHAAQLRVPQWFDIEFVGASVPATV